MKHFNHVLITQSQMKNFSGSEMVTLELAEYFLSQNTKVDIYTYYSHSPMQQELERIGATLLKEENNQNSSLDFKYDLVWVHHNTLPAEFVEPLLNSKSTVIFHHMSPHEPLELPLYPSYEEGVANLILFNSEETKDHINKNFTLNKTAKYVLGNPVPNYFYSHSNTLHIGDSLPSNIVVISNHLSTEIINAVQILKQQNIKVDFIGRTPKGHSERVTKDILSKYDVVVSIGKTVQYCLVLGKPVYCYDIFGGPGYLNKTNFNESRYFNFSGRGFKTKTAEEIASELTGKYASSAIDIANLSKEFSYEFCLNSQMTQILSNVNKNKHLVSHETIFAYRSFLLLQAKTLPTFFKNKDEIQKLNLAYAALKTKTTHMKAVRLIKTKLKSLLGFNNKFNKSR